MVSSCLSMVLLEPSLWVCPIIAYTCTITQSREYECSGVLIIGHACYMLVANHVVCAYTWWCPSDSIMHTSRTMSSSGMVYDAQTWCIHNIRNHPSDIYHDMAQILVVWWMIHVLMAIYHVTWSVALVDAYTYSCYSTCIHMVYSCCSIIMLHGLQHQYQQMHTY